MNYRNNVAVTIGSFSFWAVVLFLFSGLVSSVHAELEEGFNRRVRSFDLDFLDISKPAGLAYSPKEDKLLVIEAVGLSTRAAAGTTQVKAISLTEDKLFSNDLPVVVSNPGNMTFDSRSSRLQVLNQENDRLVRFTENQNGQINDLVSSTVNVKRTSVPKNPQGMAVDPRSSRIFFLDSDNRQIVSTNSNGRSARKIDLRGTGATQFTAIAFNPENNHPYVLSPASQKLFELTEDGRIENVFDLSEYDIRNPQSMVFAPSGDQTDAKSTMHLYIADSGDLGLSSVERAVSEQTSGQIVELAFTPVPEVQAQTSGCVATLVRETLTSLYNPPSPDPSGVAYEAASGRLVIVDGEVDEIPTLFTGDNVFETDLTGSLLFPATTTNFTSEPTGATIDPNTGNFFFTEDNNARLFELQRNTTNSSIDFDVIRQSSTSGFGSTDPEGVTFADLGGGQKALFIAEGLNNEIYRIDPGNDDEFGTSDDNVTSFDTFSKGVSDPEGIVYNDNDFLYVMGEDNNLLTEFDLFGNIVRTCDTSAVAGTGAKVKLAGLAMAPGSQNPSDFNLYFVDRAEDNNPNPNENDGRLLEAFIPLLTNSAPTADAGPDRVVILPANASLDGTTSDDGLPTPPTLTTLWTQVSGPATATILNPNSEDTGVNFPTDGTYVFRLTADDSVLTDSDDVTVTVLPAGSQTTTLAIPISQGSDDVEEKPDGTVIIGSIDLDLVRSGGDQTVGMRFNGLSIPQGATIIDAYIQFTSKNDLSEATSLTLEGEAADNAVTFVNTVNGDVSARPRTTANVPWSPAAWTTGAAGLDQRTPDLTSIVQEIVNRGGWISGNSLAVIVTGTGKREADSFEANIGTEAVLHMVVSTGLANGAPTVSITTPANGSSVTVGANVSFTGTATDPEDGSLTSNLSWVSSIDGTIGSGGSFSTTALSVGTHTITASVTDSGGLPGSDTVTVTVNPVGNTAPTVSITAPTNGSSVTEGDNVTFIGTATDLEDGTLTAGLSWASNLDGSIGTGGSFSTTGLSVGTHTVTASVIDSGGLPGTDTVTVTVQSGGGTTSIEIPISLGSDDVEERSDGIVIIGSSDLDMVQSAGSQTIGVRFNGVGIPQGATIVNAYIQFTAANTRSTITSLTLEGQAVDDATTFVQVNSDVSTRARTTANVSWSPVPWSLGDAGLDQRTPDLASIIQEIVNQAGWVSNNSLAVIITGSGKREAVTFEVNPANAAVLHVEFGGAGGGNQAPTVAISAPVSGSNFTDGDNITFTGTGTDAEDGNLSANLNWTSSIDGAIGSGNSFATTTLSVGIHTITAAVTDSGGLPGSDAITVTVNPVGNTAPTVSITAPTSGSSVTVGDSVSFIGIATDPEDGTLTAGLTWVSSLDGSIGMGGSFSTTTLSVGTHTITASVTDSGGLPGSDTVTVTVNPVGNTAPTVSITAPTNGSSVTEGDNVTFIGTATDLEDGTLTASLSWSSNLDGSIGTGGSFSTTSLSVGTHTVTASVIDSGGLPGTDTVTVTVQSGGGTTSIEIPISLGSDDVEERSDGIVIIGSSDLDMVQSGGDQTIGLRFNGITIPQGATIVNAHIQFTAANARSTVTSLTFEGEAADNATTFLNTGSGNVSARPRTTASVSWSPVPWAAAGEAGPDQRTPALTAIIQEIVNRAGWVNNNSLAIIVTGTGKREADSFEASPSNVAVLHLEFN